MIRESLLEFFDQSIYSSPLTSLNVAISAVITSVATAPAHECLKIDWPLAKRFPTAVAVRVRFAAVWQIAVGILVGA